MEPYLEIIFINTIKDGRFHKAFISTSKRVRNAKTQKFYTSLPLANASTQTMSLIKERDNRFRLGTEEMGGKVSRFFIR